MYSLQKEKEYQGDHPRFKDMILKWNDAQDIIGIPQSLWVLKIDCKHTEGLDYLDPDRFFSVVLPRLRAKYHELVRSGKIKEVDQVK